MKSFYFPNQWWLVCRQCGAAAPPIFTVNFDFKSGLCFTLTFKFTSPRRRDNVPSLPKSLCTKLNFGHSFGFVWEALQVTKVWNCERLQRRCRCSRVLERLWPVNQAQSTWNCELELSFPQRWTRKCGGL